MGNVTGFIQIKRSAPVARTIALRLHDWNELYGAEPAADVGTQSARCMDCGIPFCHQGCPLGNHIPDWNDLVYRGRWREASDRLHATNNFPEFTGRLCPAPCEGSCVLGIADEPVTIRRIELAIVEQAFEKGWIHASPPVVRTGRAVAVVGSGPAGLAAADELNRHGHLVTVFEQADRIGGLLRYGIPEFKLEKHLLDRRLQLLEAEGVSFVPGMKIGADRSAASVRAEFDAVILCCGAGQPRDLNVPGRDLAGIHFAVDYLAQQNRRLQATLAVGELPITAAGKRVVIIGGGDTGADCLGTAHRQGAATVHQLELLPRPPAARTPDNPWPEWPRIFRSSAVHDEGGERMFSVRTERFLGNDSGQVRGLQTVEVSVGPSGVTVIGSSAEIEADLVLLAMGFTGTARSGLTDELSLAFTGHGTIQRDDHWMTSEAGVFVAGDMQRGQSLIVWAIADGRHAAAAVNAYLMGSAPGA